MVLPPKSFQLLSFPLFHQSVTFLGKISLPCGVSSSPTERSAGRRWGSIHARTWRPLKLRYGHAKGDPSKKKWWKGMDLKWSWKFIVGFFSFLPFWGLVYMDFYLFGDYYITIWISISEMLRKKISVCWVTWVTIRGDYSSNDISNLMPQTITVFN